MILPKAYSTFLILKRVVTPVTEALLIMTHQAAALSDFRTDAMVRAPLRAAVVC